MTFSLIPLLNLFKEIFVKLFGLLEMVEFDGTNLLLVLVAIFCAFWGIRILFGVFGGSHGTSNK